MTSRTFFLGELARSFEVLLALAVYAFSVWVYLMVHPGQFSALNLATFVLLAIPLVGVELGLQLLFPQPPFRWTLFWPDFRAVVARQIGVTAVLILSEFLVHEGSMGRLLPALFFGTSVAVLVAWRLLLRLFLSYARSHGRNRRLVLIVGNGPEERDYVDLIRGRPGLGLRCVGYMGPEEGPMAGQIPWMGPVEDLQQVIHRQAVDFLVTRMSTVDPQFATVVEVAEREGKEVIILLDVFGARLVRSQPIDFFGRPMLSIRRNPRVQGDLMLKRLIDLGVSAAVMLLFSPLYLLVALLVWSSDPFAPVFFTQKRIGLNGRTFALFKFRTMVPEAEALRAQFLAFNEMSGPVFKIRNDPRITPVGRFLRRYSLDELPQLWNVFKGDMSLVGPRPPLPDEVQCYLDDYRRRLSVRPGITCLWQISGRNGIDFDEWMAMDLEYVDRWTLALDLQILLRTIPAVFLGRGAS